jgi:phospholipid/cholesterol/gamma-HCH transport system substrate-binding protein
MVLACVLVLTLIGGIGVSAAGWISTLRRKHVVAYFDNTNGLFRGDEVRILGVPVGAVDTVEPQPNRVKVTFWIGENYEVPADAKAAIVSPQLVTARAIQLTPAYTGGPVMGDGAVIPQSRTAVPVEWDDLRAQLAKLTDALQPTQPGGVSTLGAFVNTAADNLRGEGANIRDAIVKLSQAFSILGDHSGDVFGTIKNLSLVVSALHDSATLLRQLNTNLATVTGLLANDPNEVGQALSDLNGVVADATSFIADNKESLGTSMDKLASISRAIHDSIPDIKQTLHVAPNVFQNYMNIQPPAQMGLTGALSANNFANPISFLCGAIQAASRLGAEQSAKLCVQYLAPILKNRQYNFPPLGENLFVGALARPNELTYTEDWLRPDHVPPPPPAAGAPASPPVAPAGEASTPPAAPVPDPQPVATDPAAGLTGMMTPAGAAP